MPSQPAWFHRLDGILSALRSMTSTRLDRAAVEKLFRVRQRRARQIMAGPAPGMRDVDGSDSPFRLPGSAVRGGLMCTAHATTAGTPHHLSSGGGPCRMGSLPSTASILAGRRSNR